MQPEHQRGNRPSRNTRQFIQLKIELKTFKDFLNSRLNFDFPQGFSQFDHEKKQQVWKGQIQKLTNQRNKVCFYLPDKMTQEDVKFGIEMTQKYDTHKILDYQYESIFLGNKKQLLIYLKCQQMEYFLEKYKLPKPYEVQIKQIQKHAALLAQKKTQRNVKISLHKKQQISALNIQIQKLTLNFQKSFSKFQKIMGQILSHFKSQVKRKSIILVAIRSSIFQKLIPLGIHNQVNIQARFPQTQNDQILDVEIRKNNKNSWIYKQQNQEQKEVLSDSDKSSVVSELGEEEKLFQLKNNNKQQVPPVGIYAVNYVKYEKGVVYLKVSFQHTNKEAEKPKFLQIDSKADNLFAKQIQIEKTNQDIIAQIKMNQNDKGFINCSFRTSNDAGYSMKKNFKYHLNLTAQNNLQKNITLGVIGKSQTHIPADRSKSHSTFSSITLSTCDFSISSSQSIICDYEGNCADWGLIHLNDQQSKQSQIVEQNQYFNIVNKVNSMIYQQPAIRMEKEKKIRKVTAGRAYAMMLDSFGNVWVYGKNSCGELAIKETNTVLAEPKIIQFFNKNKIFIVDIKATQYGASFAISSEGRLYKWGLNQFLSTQIPILDRFNNIINYSLQNYALQQWQPLLIKPHFKGQKIVSICSGNEFYLMLNNQGTLYGWGQCRNLGNGIMKDGQQQQIENVCLDIELMKDVQMVAAGSDHCVVAMKDGTVFGWGKMDRILAGDKRFLYQREDVTQFYGVFHPADIIQCGNDFTCLYKASQNKLTIFGNQAKFGQSQFVFDKKLRKIQCNQDIIAFLMQNQ